MRAFAAAGVVTAAVACVACGGPRETARSPTWRSNAVAVIEQLQSDVAAAEVGGTTRASAAHALRSFSDLYALSFAFADLGGCRAMVATTGSPHDVARDLVRPCASLEQAAALFTRASTHAEPEALVRATRDVQQAEPALVQALARLRGKSL